MENNYKPSSARAKEEQRKEENVEEKKVQKVVSGPVVTRKKSGFRKLTNSIVSDDLPKVKNYVFGEVLIPTIKRAISDIVRNGVDMILYGEVDRSRRSSTPGSKVSYSAYYGDRRREEERRERRDRSYSNDLDYDDIILASRGEAELVLDQLIELIDIYGFASVSDLYDTVGKSTNNHCLNNYGWTNLSSAKVVREYDGYFLKLPRATPIK